MSTLRSMDMPELVGSTRNVATYQLKKPKKLVSMSHLSKRNWSFDKDENISLVLPNLEDYSVLEDEELQLEIDMCNLSLEEINKLSEGHEIFGTLLTKSKQQILDRLSKAEQELERRYLSS